MGSGAFTRGGKAEGPDGAREARSGGALAKRSCQRSLPAFPCAPTSACEAFTGVDPGCRCDSENGAESEEVSGRSQTPGHWCCGLCFEQDSGDQGEEGPVMFMRAARNGPAPVRVESVLITRSCSTTVRASRVSRSSWECPFNGGFTVGI